MLSSVILAAAVAVSSPNTHQKSLTVSVSIVESCKFTLDDNRQQLACNGKPPHQIKAGKIVVSTPSEERVERDQMLVVF